VTFDTIGGVVKWATMLPNLSRLQEVRTGSPRRSQRAVAPVNYVPPRDPGETPLVSTIALPDRLPGPLKIANACFVEGRRLVQNSDVGLLVVVTDDPVTGQSKTWGKARVAHHPFADKQSETDDAVLTAVRAAVADVQAYWSSHPNKAVLVHCSAGQNRSAAVVLAVLLAYGVPPDEAVARVDATRTSDAGGPGETWNEEGWEKFVGKNGQRLRQLVVDTFSRS
jgi:protein-tyrosine phosphatase